MNIDSVIEDVMNQSTKEDRAVIKDALACVELGFRGVVLQQEDSFVFTDGITFILAGSGEFDDWNDCPADGIKVFKIRRKTKEEVDA